MLLKYSVSNFKSIKNIETIDLNASVAIKDKNKKLINGKILPVIAIYGPNGGGKTTLIESIWFLQKLWSCRGDNRLLDEWFRTFKLLKNSSIKEKPSSWMIEFVVNDILYKYYISISNEKIEEESLYKKNSDAKRNQWKIVFEKKDNQINVSKEIKKTNINLNDYEISGSLLFHMYSIIQNNDLINAVTEFYKFICYDSTINFYTPKLPNFLINNGFDHRYLIDLKKEFLKIFNEIDLNIIDIILKVENGIEELFFKKNNEYGEFLLHYSLESSGTLKIIQLIVLFMKNIRNNVVFFIDELDCKLHTKLLAYIIDLFNSKEAKNSQIIFTSHDINTLDKKYLRKDEVYFAALNELYYTNVVSLKDFKFIRNDMSFSKNYIEGKLGYDPYIKKCKGWDL